MFRYPNAGRFARKDLTALHNAANLANTAFWGGEPVIPLTGQATITLNLVGEFQEVTGTPLTGFATLALTASGDIQQTALTGAGMVSLSLAGRFKPQFAGRATVVLTGAATLETVALTGNGLIGLSGTGLLALGTPLAGGASITLQLLSSGQVFRGNIVDVVASQSRAIYRAYLIADGYDDLELPISSFQARRRNGTPSYLSIVVSSPVEYIAAITERVGGVILVKSGFVDIATGAETLSTLQAVDFGTFRYDLGARSGSATLSGHRTSSARDPITRTLSGISYKSVTDGVTRVRCEPDMWLSPGDTADLGDSTFVVDTISYTIKPTLATMEVQEVSE